MTRLTRRKQYVHFPWVLLWEINHLCNLRCVYCGLHSNTDYADPMKVLDRIVNIHRPKMLTISGGEPMLIKNIDTVIRRIRAELNPYFILNTNLTRKVDMLCDLLGELDVIHTSIDAPGEYNAITRGMPGDDIVATLKRMAPIVEQLPRTSFLTMSVMTNQNWMYAADLIKEVCAISPRIVMAFAPQEPYTDPNSLGSSVENIQRFLDLVMPLREHYNFYLAGSLATKATRYTKPTADAIGFSEPEDGASKKQKKPPFAYHIQCPRQFFRMKIDPMGHEETCKPGLYIDYFAERFVRHTLRGKIFHAAHDAYLAVKTLVLSPNDMHCWFPCKCEQFIDDLLTTRDGEPVSSHAYSFQGRFSRADIEKVNSWTQEHLGHGLSKEITAVLLEQTTHQARTP